MNTPISCSGIILAGGQGLRMGGVDKGWVKWRGVPLIQQVLDRLRPQVDDIVISANRALQHYQSLGHRVVADQNQNFAGPLAGIAAGLAVCRHDWALVVACDCPLLPIDLLSQLWHSRDSSHESSHENSRLVLLHDGERLQPLFMLIHRSLLPSLQQALATQQHKVGQWARAQSPTIVRIDTPEYFVNLNTLSDLER